MWVYEIARTFEILNRCHFLLLWMCVLVFGDDSSDKENLVSLGRLAKD